MAAIKIYKRISELLDVSVSPSSGDYFYYNGSAWANRTPSNVRADLGLATSDSPQFTAINLGNASDTTITRVSAGVIAVEGTTVYLVGAALGTPSSGTLTNCTGLPVSTGISGLGTGVATALAVNTGSSGAFVVNGGALGTPSSGTLTSCTGLPVSTGISGLGTGVATALAVNVGSAGAFVTFNGAGGTPSSLTLTNGTGLPINTGLTIASQAQGDIIYYNGTNWTRLAAGTSGQFLQTQGAGANPVWATGGSGSGTKTIVRWFPMNNEPPSSNYATVNTRNSHPVLEFDTTTQEACIFRSFVPEGSVLTSGVTVAVQWAAATATTGTIGWDVAFERIASGGIDIDSDSWGTAKTITATTVPGTSGVTTVTSVNFAQADLPSSLAAGDMFRVRIRRDVATDTATGDAQLLGAYINLQ